MEMLKYTAEAHLGPGVESHFFTISSLAYASPLHTHDFFELFLITSGSAIHLVNGKQEPLTEGMLVFIRPDDCHAYAYDGDSDCSFINICFTQNGMAAAFEFLGEPFGYNRLLQPGSPPMAHMPLLEKEEMVNRLDRIRAMAVDGKAQEMQLRGLLTDLLVRHFWSHQAAPEERMPDWLESLLIQMQREEHFTAGLPRLYELAGRSAGHINRVFKEWMHTTPISYINQLKLGYTKDLLVASQLSITDIAFTAGFNNLSHFHHLFKRAFHMTPLDYRKIRMAAGKP
ncbi:helix-turn-helix domain-containing protein [Paenibacillus sp. MMS18-CY102]|uniref:helix-turn-helix domain-containing protein n=1 Tax=Paenibacillus sp. MMS18-CY102 TaxID=2682849 RepID=UPI001365308B|nr:helix-turn-helix domain-containing protein [Paenibacillus sp. MMS18-CY102]MWC31226.1 helix-turn-helix domain-containing protein [Paenibacillus sp. MMS18-CY102]